MELSLSTIFASLEKYRIYKDKKLLSSLISTAISFRIAARSSVYPDKYLNRLSPSKVPPVIVSSFASLLPFRRLALSRRRRRIADPGVTRHHPRCGVKSEWHFSPRIERAMRIRKHAALFARHATPRRAVPCRAAPGSACVSSVWKKARRCMPRVVDQKRCTVAAES